MGGILRWLTLLLLSGLVAIWSAVDLKFLEQLGGFCGGWYFVGSTSFAITLCLSRQLCLSELLNHVI